MVVWLQVKVRWRGLEPRPIGCMPTLSVTNRAAAAVVCDLWRYINVVSFHSHNQHIISSLA